MSASTASHSDATPANVKAEEHRLDADGDGDVLPQHVRGVLRDPDQLGQLARVVVHQRDVGGLDRGVGAGCAHGDAERRLWPAPGRR